jgi:hypothetical protein
LRQTRMRGGAEGLRGHPPIRRISPSLSNTSAA